MKYYVCKSINQMMYLVRNGLNVTKVFDDDFNNKYKCFLFVDNEELQIILNKYYKCRNK